MFTLKYLRVMDTIDMTTDQWREALLQKIKELEDSYKALSARISAIEIKNAADEVHRENVETRLASIEDTLKWLVRLIIAALILALIGFVVGGGLVL